MSSVLPRATPRQERSRFTVQVILEATERLLGRAEKVSTRGIARLAGISVGTLYQYFPAKEAAVAAVIDRRLATDEARIMTAFEQHRTRQLDEFVRGCVEEIVPATDWERALYPQMVDTLESLGRLEAVQRLLMRFEALLAKELVQRTDEIAKEIDPQVAATVIVHGARATLLSLARQHPDLPRTAIMDQITRFAMGYLKAAGQQALPIRGGAADFAVSLGPASVRQAHF